MMINKIWSFKIIRILVYIHLVVLLLIGIFFLGLRYKNSIKYEAAIQKIPYDVIIVPGLPYNEVKWELLMQQRIYWAKHLLDQGYAKNIIFSGSAVYTPYIESLILKEYAIKIGIPQDIIFIEQNAEHSTENLYYSYLLAKEKNFNKIALATDPLQSFLLTFFVEDQDLDVYFLPIHYGILEQLNIEIHEIDASRAYVPNFVPLPERENFFKRFRGTLGERIKYVDIED